MNPQMRRFLPLILIAFVAIAFLPQILKSGKGSKTLSAKDRAAITLIAADRIDRAETAYLTQHGRYTGHLSDLVLADKQLAANLTVPLSVEVDASTDGKSYLARVSSDVLSVARSRAGREVTASSCRVLKSGSDVKCPEAKTAPTAPTTTAG